MFNPFERMVAMRYLRARRREGFISVIAGFSLLGIGLGVATLIIVMSVMNGFRQELLGRILGVGGHVNVYGAGAPLQRFDDMAERIRKLTGVVSVIPVVDGQVMATANSQASGAVVRGVRGEDIKNRAVIANNIKMGSLDAFSGDDAILIGVRMAQRPVLRWAVAGERATSFVGSCRTSTDTHGGCVSPKAQRAWLANAPLQAAWTRTRADCWSCSARRSSARSRSGSSSRRCFSVTRSLRRRLRNTLAR